VPKPSIRPARSQVGARGGMLAGAGLLCLLLAPATAAAQGYTEGSTHSTAPPPADSLEATDLKVPTGSPPYFLSTYRSSMSSPLPARIWRQGGIPRVIQPNEQFANAHGRVGTYNAAGATITTDNAFFQALGTNGRSCATCHNPPSGLGLSLQNIRARFRANLNDPLFAPVDGANCPDAVPAAYTSGSLYGGNRGTGRRALKDAYSMLLTRGLIRVPIKVPANAEYTVTVLSDMPGCNLSRAYSEDPVTGEKILSVYRRPILSANLRFKVQNDDPGISGDTNLMWDGRERSPRTQAVDATLGHAQAAYPPTEAQIDQMVDFQARFFTAQIMDKQAGRLDINGAFGGPVYLAGRTTVPPPGFPAPPAFDEYGSWANLAGNARADERASIERGQAIFLAKPLTVANVGGFNDLIGLNPVPPRVFPVFCQTCHGMPHAGSELVFPPQRDIGVGGQAATFNGARAAQGLGTGPAPAGDMPIFQFDCSAHPHPFYGATVVTNDPGKGLITGKCADLGKTTVPQLRALAARAPYFHNGSAKDLGAVVDFYNQRFAINLTAQERTDLVNFLSAL
jgi:cytochrome c peroxidase